MFVLPVQVRGAATAIETGLVIVQEQPNIPVQIPVPFKTVQNHILPAMEKGLPEMKEKGTDIFTRGAPALLLFHAHRDSVSHTEDIQDALTYGLLAAHSLGLGATAIGLIPPAVERNRELRKLFQVPKDNEVLASMILGYPKVPFKRGIQRKLAEVTWI